MLGSAAGAAPSSVRANFDEGELCVTDSASGEVQYRRTWVFVNSQTSTLALCLRNDTDVTGYRIPRIPRPAET